MSESERSEPYGASDSGDEAAELEQLRREAALLREQLENAVGPQSGLRSARVRRTTAAPLHAATHRR